MDLSYQFLRLFSLTAINNEVNTLVQQCVQEETSCDSAPCLCCLLSCVINGWVLFSIVEGILDLERAVRYCTAVLFCRFLHGQKAGTSLGTLGQGGMAGGQWELMEPPAPTQAAERSWALEKGQGAVLGSPSLDVPLCQAWGAEGRFRTLI